MTSSPGRRPIGAALGPLLLTALLLSALAHLVVAGPAQGQVAPSTESAEEVRSAIDEILQRPAYTGINENPIARLLRDNPVTRFFLDIWQDFIDWFSRLGFDRDESQPTTERDQNRTNAFPLILILATILVAFLAYRLAATRQEAAERARRAAAEADLTAHDLERAADEAERRGDYNEAVRLRFRAGLDRLDEVGALDLEPGLITGRVRTALAMREFDEVANQFEAAAYSEHVADAEEATAARAGWAAILRRVVGTGEGPEEPS